jgi:hypothetical protein
LEDLRHTVDDKFIIDVKEVVFDGVDWIHLAQNRDKLWVLVNTIMNLRVA